MHVFVHRRIDQRRIQNVFAQRLVTLQQNSQLNVRLIRVVVATRRTCRLQIFAATNTRSAHMMLAHILRRVRFDQQIRAHRARQRLPQIRHQTIQIGIIWFITIRLVEQTRRRHIQTDCVHLETFFARKNRFQMGQCKAIEMHVHGNNVKTQKFCECNRNKTKLLLEQLNQNNIRFSV